MSSVAAPIYDYTGQVVAAVVVAGPTYRIGPEEVETFVMAVQQTAQVISVQLGSGSTTS